VDIVEKMGRLTLGETSGYRRNSRKVWISYSYGGWSRLLCLFRLANHHKCYRPCCRGYENYNNQTNRPVTPVRPRYDKITRESKYCLGVTRAKWRRNAKEGDQAKPT